MDITLTFTLEEQQAFLQIIDAALRHAGGGALDVAAHFKGRLASAAAVGRPAMQTAVHAYDAVPKQSAN